MDFMKVFDQTVREIKREVNLKVLKVPEIEQKVLDATDDEPWGPHGTVLAEIADATKRFTDCQIVMNVLWTRLTETDKNWRLVYKALTVIEYLVGHGSERAVDDIIEHTFQISSLASFEYVEPSGKDLGINVRKKAETIVGLLNDKDKIQEVRNKAAANREKYFGLSSSGITYKSGAASFSSSNFGSSDRYGGFGSTGGSSSFRDTYKDNDRSEDKYENTNNSKKEPARYGSKKQGSSVSAASKASTKSKPDKHGLASSQNSSSDKYSEEFDDFDPRGTSTAKPSSGGNQVDLFAQSIVGDLLDAPVSTPTDTISKLGHDSSEVDLFADAAFVSATPAPESSKVTAPQGNINLFDSAPAPTVSTTMDFFASPDTLPQPNSNPTSQPDTTSNAIDPFASVPLNNFEGSDPFGAFTSNANPPSESGKGYSNEGSGGNANASSSSLETKSPPKKESFQVKSGIWADSLSRGLIDLNITAPKKVNLADVGIVGGLTDGSEEKGPLPSFYMGGSMRVGSGGGSMAVGSGKSGFASTTTSDDDDFFSSLSNPKNQSGSFQK